MKAEQPEPVKTEDTAPSTLFQGLGGLGEKLKKGFGEWEGDMGQVTEMYKDGFDKMGAQLKELVKPEVERDLTACPDGVPVKSMIYIHHHFDSTRWALIAQRKDDIILVSAGMASTVWTESIIEQMLYCKGDRPTDEAGKPVALHDFASWVELRRVPEEDLVKLDNVKHRRILTSHLPADTLQYNPEAKYIYVARDERDEFMAWYQLYKMGTPKWYDAMMLSKGGIGKLITPFSEAPDIDTQFKAFLEVGNQGLGWEKDGYPVWSFFRNTRTWWECRKMPNILFVHYAALHSDLAGQMKRMAAFLGIDVPEEKWADVVQASSLAALEAKGELYPPEAHIYWKEGPEKFADCAKNGTWMTELSRASIIQYDQVKIEKLPPGLNYYLETGNFESGCTIDENKAETVTAK